MSSDDSNLLDAARLAKCSLPFHRLTFLGKSRDRSLCKTVNFMAGRRKRWRERAIRCYSAKLVNEVLEPDERSRCFSLAFLQTNGEYLGRKGEGKGEREREENRKMTNP